MFCVTCLAVFTFLSEVGSKVFFSIVVVVPVLKRNSRLNVIENIFCVKRVIMNS